MYGMIGEDAVSGIDDTLGTDGYGEGCGCEQCAPEADSAPVIGSPMNPDRILDAMLSSETAARDVEAALYYLENPAQIGFTLSWAEGGLALASATFGVMSSYELASAIRTVLLQRDTYANHLRAIRPSPEEIEAQNRAIRHPLSPLHEIDGLLEHGAAELVEKFARMVELSGDNAPRTFEVMFEADAYKTADALRAVLAQREALGEHAIAGVHTVAAMMGTLAAEAEKKDDARDHAERLEAELKRARDEHAGELDASRFIDNLYEATITERDRLREELARTRTILANDDVSIESGRVEIHRLPRFGGSAGGSTIAGISVWMDDMEDTLAGVRAQLAGVSTRYDSAMRDYAEVLADRDRIAEEARAEFKALRGDMDGLEFERDEALRERDDYRLDLEHADSIIDDLEKQLAGNAPGGVAIRIGAGRVSVDADGAIDIDGHGIKIDLTAGNGAAFLPGITVDAPMVEITGALPA